MRRNDHDVSDSIRTTDAGQVRGEVMRVFRGLYDGKPPRSTPAAIERAFDDLVRAYRGEDDDYQACDTEYHDIQHVLDVTLAMARLMDGYERSREVTRSRVGDSPHLPPECFALGVITALYHDFGYLKKRSDRRHRYGAEYTLSHVTRGSKHLGAYLPRLGLRRLANAAATLVHYTGYERATETIPVNDTLLRRVGHMLGTADIIAQMSDRCYLEKCRDRLFPEFVLGGLAQRRMPNGKLQVIFGSGDDLVKKTPGFYANAAKRLDFQLARAYDFAATHFGGQNLYVEEMQKNVRHAQVMATKDNTDALRREPPHTLLPGVVPYPKDMVIR
jgi:hypothetical protein